MPGTREPVEPWSRGAVLPMGPVDGAPRSGPRPDASSTLTLFAPSSFLWRLHVFCQIFVGRFGVSFSPFERLFLGRFGFGQSCGLSVIA